MLRAPEEVDWEAREQIRGYTDPQLRPLQARLDLAVRLWDGGMLDFVDSCVEEIPYFTVVNQHEYDEALGKWSSCRGSCGTAGDATSASGSRRGSRWPRPRRPKQKVFLPPGTGPRLPLLPTFAHLFQMRKQNTSNENSCCDEEKVFVL